MSTALNERLNAIMHLQDACGPACVPLLHLYHNKVKVMRDIGISNPLSASTMTMPAACWEHDGHPVPHQSHLHIDHHTQALLRDED